MALTLYLHPLASFCHKVLIALYEGDVAFEAKLVDFGNPGDTAELFELWPVGKIPVLRDAARNRVVPETSIIIEYVAQHFPSAARLLPEDRALLLDVRLWDRFFDCYVQVPMQRIVADRIRPAGTQDAHGVAEARTNLHAAYDMLEPHLAARRWATGDLFTMADCAAAPALFYASILEPFGDARPHLSAYFERLLERPSVRRTLVEAKPYFHMFPFNELMPQRLREIA